MAKKKPAEAIVTLSFPSEELKQEAIKVFCKEHGYINLKAEGTIDPETTEEEFFTEKVGDFVLQKISAARIKDEKAAVALNAVKARNEAKTKVDQSLKDIKIK